MTRSSTRSLTAAAAMLIATACGSTAAPQSPDGAGPSAGTAVAERARSEDGASPPARGAVAAQEETAEQSGGEQIAGGAFEDLRNALERSLGHHALLDIRSTRGELNDDPAYVQDATASLADNTEELTTFARNVAGEALAQEFNGLWFGHVNDVIAYARATAAGDDAAQEAARDGLEEYASTLGRRLSEVTGGAIQEQAAAASIGAHVGTMMDQVDAYAAGDFATAYELQRQAYRQMFPIAAGIAAAFAAAGTEGDRGGADPQELLARGPEQELRASLGVLFGEHAALATDLTRASLRGAEEFQAAADTLATNTRELTGAVEALLGPDAAQGFAQVWGRQSELYVDYAVAQADGDQSTATRVTEELAGLREALTSALGAGGGAGTAARQLGAALEAQHATMLDGIAAYAAGDFASASAAAQESFDQLFTAAGRLASAFDEAASLPLGGAQTGGGGAARSS